MHMARPKAEDTAALNTIYDAGFAGKAADGHGVITYASDWEFSGQLCYESSNKQPLHCWMSIKLAAIWLAMLAMFAFASSPPHWIGTIQVGKP